MCEQWTTDPPLSLHFLGLGTRLVHNIVHKCVKIISYGQLLSKLMLSNNHTIPIQLPYNKFRNTL